MTSVETASSDTHDAERAQPGGRPDPAPHPAPDPDPDPANAPESKHQESADHTSGRGGLPRAIISAVFFVVLLGAAGVAAWWMTVNAPQQETVTAAPTLPTVDVMTPVFGSIGVSVEGFGEIIPAREASIAPEVIGRVIEVGPSIEPGGLVDEGDLLFRIDPADYEVAVAQSRADLAQAEADLELERGRAMVAQQEWERFRESLEGVEDTERSSALANREPQLRQAEARVQQAEAALALATLMLDRTEVRAPFRATVVRETVEVGLRVGPDMTVVDLAGTDVFWATVAVPPSQGSRLSTSGEAGPIPARVTVDSGLGARATRDARVVRILPNVDQAGRMVRVLVAIDDPLALDSDGDVVRLGDYASVSIDGRAVDNAVELPREAIRENDQLWVLSDEGTLRVIPVDIRWRSEATVIASADFQQGDRVITSFLNDPLPGQRLQARGTR